MASRDPAAALGHGSTAWKPEDGNLTAAQRIQWLAENPDICEIILTADEAQSLWDDRVWAATRIVELEREITVLSERQATAESGPKDALAPITELLRGSHGHAGEQAIVQRTPAEYKALWQEVYDASLTKGRGENLARHDANARLMRLRAQDEGRPVLGSGDIESYQ